MQFPRNLHLSSLPKPVGLVLLLGFLFLFRLGYGLCSEFWFEDELQIYLIGLKFFTTGAWPYYGPDVVYTQTQIAGALQGILSGGPLFLCPIPESPLVLVNLLSFGSLTLFGWYVNRRFPAFPSWIIFCWLMMAPWTINYGTRVVNPSYVIIFAIPFFVSFIDMFNNQSRLINHRLAFFVMGFTLLLIMQLHLSWVLLIPFASYAFLIQWHRFKNQLPASFLFFTFGLIVGAATLIPTLLYGGSAGRGVESNIVFNADNIKNGITVLVRYLAFASAEINYWLGGNTAGRLAVVNDQIWMAPAVIFLLLTGFAQVFLFVMAFFQKNSDQAWLRMKWLTLGTFFLVYASFFFSIKGPSSHTFVVVMPIPLFYSFYCYEWLMTKHKLWRTMVLIALFFILVFNTGMAVYGFTHKSLYRDRQKVLDAIEQNDYHILGERRSDGWGYP